MGLKELNAFKDNDYVKMFFVDLGYITIKKTKVVGFCLFSYHRGWLTERIAKTHDCYNKKCAYLRKVKGHPYWRMCDAKISAAHSRKDKIKKEKNERTRRLSKIEDKLCEMADFAQAEADDRDFDIIITRVAFLNGRTDRQEYVINYVSDVPKKDCIDYFDICKSMRRKFGGMYWLRKVKKPDGKYITINEWLGEDYSLPKASDEDEFIDVDEWIKEQEKTDEQMNAD